jgi:metallo-beta-lactamase family protein
MRISFHGAAQGVTGSCHLLETGSTRVLVDCGLFQGSRKLKEENGDPFGFDPVSLDAVVLTHAHLDHVGRLPKLVKEGFQGKIYATGATQELARLVLLDSARLQEEEAARAKRRRGRGKPTHDLDEEVICTEEDVEEACLHFAKSVPYHAPVELAPGLRFTLSDAGHILGSSSVLFELQKDGSASRVVFSGDIGSRQHPVVRDPEPSPAADLVVMETTYGGRKHRSVLETATEFFQVLTETLEGSGNVLIPTFALERAQEVLYGIREGIEHQRLPKGFRTFLDSPMAASATEIFRRHPECFDQDTLDVLASRDPFSFEGLAFTRDRVESKAINDVKRGAVILAGNGMLTGGRARHHLERILPRADCTLVFVGYAAAGTPARRLIDGEKILRLFGQDVPVRCRIATINGFSGHGDHDQLVTWHEGAGKPSLTVLVHGDPKGSLAMKEDLEARGFKCAWPELHEVIEL